MSDQNLDSGTHDASSSNQSPDSIRHAASNTAGKISQLARDTGSDVKRTVAESASNVGTEVRGMLNKQLNESWKAAGQVAASLQLAAEDLDGKSPIGAGVVRNVAEKLQDYAENGQHPTIEQMVRSASEFARRQPAAAFGLGALAGFMLLRAIKSAGAAAPSDSVVSRYE